MATEMQHMIFEALGVMLGIILIIVGIKLLSSDNNFIAWSLIVLGTANALVDIWFLTTFLS